MSDFHSERELWKRMADEIDAHLAQGEDEVGLFEEGA